LWYEPARSGIRTPGQIYRFNLTADYIWFVMEPETLGLDSSVN
jgi:hypothetical protein